VTLHIDCRLPPAGARPGAAKQARVGVPSLLPEATYRGRVWETGAGARTAPATALQAAVSRSFQTTPCRPLVGPAVDVFAPPLVICGKVKELAPRVWEATLPCDVPELSGDLPVMFTVRILPARWQSALGRRRKCVSIRRCPTQPHRAGTHSVCDRLDEDRISHDYLGNQITRCCFGRQCSSNLVRICKKFYARRSLIIVVNSQKPFVHG
jgi:hypothetical protein